VILTQNPKYNQSCLGLTWYRGPRNPRICSRSKPALFVLNPLLGTLILTGNR